ncbi:MAG: Gfo/Idh/MocA family oxidoreductase [Rhodospirillales bacterium]|nr:Gfo/Idh/MocA family oxidoreductase [Rhodospirillales bacterium]
MRNPSNNDRPVGVAVWGIGAHAVRSVLPALSASPDVQLIGLCSRNGQTLATQAAAHQCLAWSSPEPMLASPAVDVVYLASPTGLHCSQGQQVLAQGKHLWCEKPLATRMADAELLLGVATARGLSLAVVCGPCYHPHFAAVREQLDSHVLGDLRHIEAGFRFPHLAPDNFRYNPDQGGGALLDVGFYLLSLVDDLIDEELESLECQLVTDSGYQVDTGGRALMAFAGGATAHLVWGYGYAYENHLTVTGSAASLVAEPFFSKPQSREPSVRLTDRQGRSQTIAFDNPNQFVEMVAVFVRGLHDVDVQAQLIARARRSQLLIERARESDQRNAAVMVN